MDYYASEYYDQEDNVDLSQFPSGSQLMLNDDLFADIFRQNDGLKQVEKQHEQSPSASTASPIKSEEIVEKEKEESDEGTEPSNSDAGIVSLHIKFKINF